MANRTTPRHSISQPTIVPSRPIVALRPVAPLQDLRHQDICLRAYQHFTQRMAESSHGDALSDWLRAESELRGEALMRGDAE